MTLNPGTRLGPYDIESPVATGGMGEVYRARDPRLHRSVAIKIVARHISGSRSHIERFEREARAASALNHPNICAVFDVGETLLDGVLTPYLVMELIEGETLTERLIRGPLPVSEIIDLSVALADALDAAHHAGFVHRDIKPANIMLTAHGPKILDFGLAKPVVALGGRDTTDETIGIRQDHPTDPGTMIGTPAYMSPEQLRGETVDARSDLFSLGLVMYEMATGQTAFGRSTNAAIVGAILHEAPARPRDRRLDLPAPLEQAILKALEKDRELRSQSASEMRAELKRLKRMLEPAAVKSPSPSSLPPPAPAKERADPSAPLKVAVVDDEALARAVLIEYLSAMPDVEIVAECANGFDAVKAVADLKPDLLLLDVQMPKLDGFEVLELVGRDVAVIFVTAYDQYALKAFEVHAVDYLLKPFSQERLGEALDRARTRLGRGEMTPVDELSADLRRDRPASARVLVRDGAKVHVLPVTKIAYAQAQDDYVCFSCDGKSYLKEQTLSQVEGMLDPAKFVRIHRSYLLNLDFLARTDVDERENRIAVLNDGRTLPVSRAGYARLSELL